MRDSFIRRFSSIYTIEVSKLKVNKTAKMQNPLINIARWANEKEKLF